MSVRKQQAGSLPRRPSRFPAGRMARTETLAGQAYRRIKGAEPDRRHPPIVVDLVPPKMVERRRVIPLGRID
jgi:hypothetical protein